MPYFKKAHKRLPNISKMDYSSLSHNLQLQLQQMELSDMKRIEKSSQSILLCRHLLAKFRTSIVSHKFDSNAKEIEFFKFTKQVPLSNLIYYTELFAFESEFPKGGKTIQIDFINEKINKLNSFFAHHMNFTNYITLGNTHFDNQYFVRQTTFNVHVIDSEAYFFDMDFSTSHDLLLGKFHAYKRLITYLELLIDSNNKPMSISRSKLKWTASQSAFTELTYALYHSNIINEGNVGIKEIATALQQVFNMQHIDFYRIYSEIKSRKKSRTKFLDDLSSRLIQEMDNQDG